MRLPGLREAREHKGFSLRKLGEVAGMSYPRISQLENGGEARESTARKLAEALGVNVKFLQTDEVTKMRGQTELLEWRLRQYRKQELQGDARWLNLHGIASLMAKRTSDERLRERLEYVAEESLEAWADLFDWPEEFEEAEEKETA